MDPSKKQARYQRIDSQIEALMPGSPDPAARMATIAAVLHHKIDYFFWTGFYLLRNGKLTVQVYQGPLACMVLREHTGVCWAGIDQGKSIVVPDVHLFPGHIAC
ncbi:MAG TPA: GAF domain-containing protein, partial [Bacteroidales bacterium]|nr:GAF domain-containing protein [Bacteroidales bacterium]HPT09042.1 GAF domain-containing protein [Bacteroidales bacterium]